jgi:phage terminase large subunit
MKVKIPVKMNKVYYPYLDCQSSIQIFYGGSSSGKSYWLAQRCILSVLYKNKNWLITRNVGVTLRDSTFNEIKKAINKLKLSRFFKVNETNMVVTCLLNKKQIIFKGLDDVEKLKSITPIDGVIDYIWIEEATETSEVDFNQLEKRLRGCDDEAIEQGIKQEDKKIVIFSFNPIFKTHWIYKRFFLPVTWSDKQTFYQSEDLLILKTTYKDNKFLTRDDIKRIEDTKDPYMFTVYVLGEWGVLEGVVFRFTVEDLTSLIPTFDKRKAGGDFGFYPDPAAMSVLQFDKRNRKIYIFDELYIRECSDELLADKIKEKIGTLPVTFDSAEPKTIKKLQTLGVRARAAIKGPDSVDFGIKFLKKYDIIIHKACQNTINEFTFYRLKKDQKTGEYIPGKYQGDDHLIDCVRYSLEDEFFVKEGAEVRQGTRMAGLPSFKF